MVLCAAGLGSAVRSVESRRGDEEHGRLPGMSRQGNKLDEALERRRTGQREVDRICRGRLDPGGA